MPLIRRGSNFYFDLIWLFIYSPITKYIVFIINQSNIADINADVFVIYNICGVVHILILEGQIKLEVGKLFCSLNYSFDSGDQKYVIP